MIESDIQELRAIQSDIERTLEALLPSPTSGVALLDVPIHNNIGDSLIWEGELKTFSRMGVPVLLTSDFGRHDQAAIDRLKPEVPLLLHGGGNFGDLWGFHQPLRELIITTNPKRAIICLPQSIYFREPVNAARANRIFGQHENIIVLVRDHDSLMRARIDLPDVNTQFCPDMAYGNDPFQGSANPWKDLIIARQDLERDIDLRSAKQSRQDLTDWHLQPLRMVVWTLAMFPLWLFKRSGTRMRRRLSWLVNRMYEVLRNLNLQAGRAIFFQARSVASDRLHAQVLATLMGIPNLLFENSYGKNRPIFDDYSKKFSTTNFEEIKSQDELAAKMLQFVESCSNQ